MGEVILSRLLDKQVYQPEEVIISLPTASRRDFIKHKYGVQVTKENQLVLSVTETVLLAIKPQVLGEVVKNFSSLKKESEQKPLILSILAGVPISKLESSFPGHPAIRTMPTPAAMINAGVTAIAYGETVEQIHQERARQIFQAMGEVLEIPENLIDAFTAIAGSGTGYIAVFIEALIDGAVAAGLPRTTATQLALKTLRGTAQILQELEIHPAQLKDRLTSPNGTTIAGIAYLEQSGFRSAVIEAVRSACQRAQELGNGNS
jgi:pyrroline-5-carboxylate reductase